MIDGLRLHTLGSATLMYSAWSYVSQHTFYIQEYEHHTVRSSFAVLLTCEDVICKMHPTSRLILDEVECTCMTLILAMTLSMLFGHS